MASATTVSQPVMTDEQVREFDQRGAVTIDTPISHERIDAAAARMEKLDEQGVLVGPNTYLTDPEILDIIQEPFLEEVAKCILRAPAVEYFLLAALRKRPTPGKP